MKLFFQTYIIIYSIIFSGCSTSNYHLLDGNESIIKTVDDLNYSNELEFEWKISKGDRVEIIVTNQSAGNANQEFNVLLNSASRMGYQNRDGTEGFLIPPDGFIHLPLIGAIKISGLTETQAVDKITKAYLRYLKNPYVIVKILNQKLFVLGEVNRPGVVQVTNGTMSLFEALAYAGDLTNDAQRTNIRVIRGNSRNPEVREINIAQISDIKLTSLLLRPNDIIYVQPRTMKAYNVAIREQMPFFELIHTILTPFVDYTNIKNGNAIDVFK